MTTSESENNMQQIADASHPFNLPSADIILLTPDLTRFHVHSSILSLASPVFHDMFSLPQQHGNDALPPNSTQPIVAVMEDSDTLERLLRLCYPTTKPTLDALDDIVHVLEAAMKYDMGWMIPLLVNNLKVAVPQNPVKAWVTASRLGHASEEVAREAASAMLAIIRSNVDKESADSGTPASPLTIMDAMIRGQGDEVLRGVSAGNYFRLRQFILSENSNSSFRLLTPPQVFTSHTVFEAPSPSALILRIGPPDIRLQCLADGTSVEAHSSVISFHSSILREKIKLEVASESIPDQSYDQNIDRPQKRSHPLPTILLETRPDTLAVLLGLCYGTMTPPSHLPLLASALVYSMEYSMHQVEQLIAQSWDELAELHPLEAYFVAVQNGLETCARAAARAVLKHPMVNSYVDIMESSSALAYLRILDYHRLCTDAAKGHLKRMIREWNAPPQIHESFAPRHTDVMVAYLSSLAEKIDSEGHGPGTALDVDLSGLFRRFCSSGSSVGDNLWLGKGVGYCTWVVDKLLDISVTTDTVAQVELNLGMLA